MKNRLLCALCVSLCLIVACNRDPNVAKQKYLESGNKYYDQGRYKEAFLMYGNALKRDQKFGEAYYRRALALLKVQRYADAVKDLQRAVELQPQNLDAHVRLANIFLNVYMGDARKPVVALTELRSIHERLVTRFPKSYDEARLRGYLALFENKREEALAAFASAQQAKPYEPELVLIYMQALVASNRAKEAEDLALETTKRHPDALSIYDALYLSYARQNRLPEAENTLKTKIEKNPKEVSSYLQLAAHYMSVKQNDAASAILRKVSESPDFPSGPKDVGSFYVRTNQLDLAVQQFERGIQRSEKDKPAYQKLIAEIRVLQNRRDDAARIVADVLKENPKDDDAIAMRAALSLLTGGPEQVDSAINDLQSVLARVKDNPVLRYNLGRAYLSKGNSQAAKVQFEESIKINPSYMPARIALGQVLLNQRDYGRLAKSMEETLLIAPNNPSAMLLRSRALIGLNDVKQARDIIAKAESMYPALPEVQIQSAALNLREGKYSEAERLFDKVYSASKDRRALMGLVDAQVAQGKPAGAVQLLRGELTKNPDDVPFRMALGNIMLLSKDPAGALAEYKQVLDKNPKNAQVWNQMAAAYSLAGDRNNVELALKKVRDLTPNDPDAHVRLATWYDGTGRQGEAKPLYEATLRLKPDHPMALNNLAYILADQGTDLDQALTMAQRAKQQLPNNPFVDDTLAWIYVKKNLPDSAIGIYKDLITKAPNSALLRYHYAIAISQKGDKPQAKRELEAALKANPTKIEETKIREMLAQLG